MGADPRLGAPLPPHHELPQSEAPHPDLHYEMLEAKLAHCLRLDGDYATPRRGLRARGQLPAAPSRSVRSQELKVRDSQTIRPYKQQGLRPGEQTPWPCWQGATTGWPCLRGATTGFHGTLCLKISHWLSQ